MVDITNAAQDLFFKLRNRFPKISMGDEDSNATVDPEAARFFNFIYTDKDSGRSYGHVTCSIIDNSSLKVFFDTQITADMLPEDKPYWFRFLRELRRMAKSHMLNFDVRDITKDTLSRQDFQYMTKLNPEKKKITKESINEGKVLWNRRGKVSEGNVNNVTIHVVHSEKMLENSNNRLLKVDRIFCVNENGEKFLLPFKSVSGAKAMANHIGRGGNPYDASGQVISRAVSEMRNLSRFASATRTKTFESEEANQVISAAQQMKESIRGHLLRLSNNSRNFSESLETLTKLLPESDQDISELKGWFTTQAYNENLDNYLGSAAGAYQRLKENALAEAPEGVEQKVMNPEFKLVLKADPAMDKLMTSRKYTDNVALLVAVMGDIANRCIAKDGDDIANFASMMGDLISSEGDAFGQTPNPDYTRDKKLAIMLAQKYMKDLAAMRSNPEYAASVRQDPDARPLMKDRKSKKVEDTFEETIMNMGEAPIAPIRPITAKKATPVSTSDTTTTDSPDGPGTPQAATPAPTDSPDGPGTPQAATPAPTSSTISAADADAADNAAAADVPTFGGKPNPSGATPAPTSSTISAADADAADKAAAADVPTFGGQPNPPAVPKSTDKTIADVGAEINAELNARRELAKSGGPQPPASGSDVAGPPEDYEAMRNSPPVSRTSSTQELIRQQMAANPPASASAKPDLNTQELQSYKDYSSKNDLNLSPEQMKKMATPGTSSAMPQSPSAMDKLKKLAGIK